VRVASRILLKPNGLARGSYTGWVIEFKGDGITLETDYGDRLAIPWSHIDTLQPRKESSDNDRDQDG
jgi:hypothetical protein